MSQIDEAFIQAYATPQQPAAVPGAGEVPVAPAQPPLAGLHRGPYSQFPTVTQPSTQPATQTLTKPPAETPATNQWAPEPIPAPHFQAASVPNQVAEAVAPTGQGSERRPLSSFSAPAQPATTAFNPVFEVDEFRWPKVVNELLAAHHELLIPVAEQLVDVSEQGRSLVGIAGTRTNVGCSTLLLCLARLIGSIGKSIALVDANFSKASLARDLGLEFDTGWENALTGDLPLAECVVRSINDRMALLPLARTTPHAEQLLSSIHTSVTAGMLRYHYDLVLFNLGEAARSPQDVAAFSIMEHCRLDAGIIVADTEQTGIDPMDTLIALFGSNCLGVIGNSAT